MMFKSADVFTQLQPRHVCRRERRPGLRERHSAQRQRFTTEHDVTNQSDKSSNVQNVKVTSSYSMNSAISDFSRNYPKTNDEPVTTVSQYKELSTIEDIRRQMKSTARVKSAPPTHVPDWMINLDINLDVTSVDLIPPYSEAGPNQKSSDTFTESPSFMYLDDDDDEADIDDVIDDVYKDNLDINKSSDKVFSTRTKDVSSASTRNIGTAKPSSARNRGTQNTFRIAQPFTPEKQTNENNSPRRYQGDKRVMSLQQGGIRSTPMQPKSKKFINQMLTYNHMKHHDRKLKVAKPAVDTKMPSTFKYALERKQLVEQRLSQSWSRPSQTSTPSKSPDITHKATSTPRER
ncbi:hypothetical protein ACF0H5_013836 [Mactra antiquata]